ncbi:MAG: SPOR domain-containing protein, partial [Blastocatellia bacterium]
MFLLAIIAAAQSGKFTVQIVAVPSQAEAEVTVRELKANGIEAYILKSQVPGKGMFYRVRAGVFNNASDARKYGETLKQQAIVEGFFIAPYERPAPPPATLLTPEPAKENSASSQPAGQPAGKPTDKPATKIAVIPIAPATKKEPPKEIAANNAAKNSPGKESAAPPVASSAGSPAPAVSFSQFKDPQIGFT